MSAEGRVEQKNSTRWAVTALLVEFFCSTRFSRSALVEVFLVNSVLAFRTEGLLKTKNVTKRPLLNGGCVSFLVLSLITHFG